MYARGCWKHGRNSGSVGMPGLQKHLGKVWLKKTLEQSLCLFHHQWGAVGSSQVGSWWCRVRRGWVLGWGPMPPYCS